MCEQNDAGLLSVGLSPTPPQNCGDPQPYKFHEKISAHFRDKFFQKFNFWRLGDFPIREKVCVDVPHALNRWSKFGPDQLRFGGTFLPKKLFSALPPVETVPGYTRYKYSLKNSNNGVVDGV